MKRFVLFLVAVAFSVAAHAQILGGILGGGSASPSFDVQLIHTLVPRLAVGSATPTFTRATAADQIDFEGLHHQVLSGEARFQGARRVRNQLTFTEDLTNGAWTKVGTATAPNATTVNLPAETDAIRQTGIASVSGDTFVYRVQLSGTGTTTLISTGTGDSDHTITLTGTPTTYSFAATANTTAVGLWVIRRAGNTATAVTATKFQLEKTTGQTNQNPSEYVSVGVLSAPFHGANVDGVKYFDTLNGNTVASNVVTEATGAHIDSSQAAAAGGVTAGVVDVSGPVGYLAEGAATNLHLYSQLFSNTAWNKTNTTVTSENNVAPDGTATAALLTEGGAGAVGVENNTNVTVTANQTHTISRFAKRGNTDWVVLVIYDAAAGTDFVQGFFNLATGAVGTAVNGGNGTGAAIRIKAEANGWYRLILSGKPNATGTAMKGYSSSATADNNSTHVNSSTRYEWGAQFESNSSIATSYIPTTTVAVTRNADVLTYPSAGNINLSQGSAYAEVAPITADYSAGRVAFWLGTTTGGRLLESDSDTHVRVIDSATNIATATVPALAGHVTKIASSWGTSGMAVTGGGVAPATQASFAGMASNVIGIGTTNAGFSQPNGTIRNVRIYPRALPSARLKNMTGSFLDVDRFGIRTEWLAANDELWRKAA